MPTSDGRTVGARLPALQPLGADVPPDSAGCCLADPRRLREVLRACV